MGIKIIQTALGMVQTNCYIVGDSKAKSAVVIDPADNAPAIKALADTEGWQIKLILATHAHFDHVMAVDALRQLTGAPFWMHEADAPILQAMQMTGQLFGLQLGPPPEYDKAVEEGTDITVDGISFEVRHTPGHTPGHVSYVFKAERIVFCGDCLFKNSIGRTDLPGGNHDTLMASITSKLMTQDDDYRIAPGHGAYSTIGDERASNPFLTGSF